jgi:hypothetical protein
MRWLLVGVALLGAAGCAGFKSVDRGEWRLVYVDTTRRDAEAPREVIARDAYEAEVSEGTRRGVTNPQGFLYPLLHETDAIGLKVGEVAGFRIDEATDAELFVDGTNVKLYWGTMEKRDAWQGDRDVTIKESALFVKGTGPGKATLRVTRGANTKDVPVTVK